MAKGMPTERFAVRLKGDSNRARVWSPSEKTRPGGLVD
jgi:hypothetical protein